MLIVEREVLKSSTSVHVRTKLDLSYLTRTDGKHIVAARSRGQTLQPSMRVASITTTPRTRWPAICVACFFLIVLDLLVVDFQLLHHVVLAASVPAQISLPLQIAQAAQLGPYEAHFQSTA